MSFPPPFRYLFAGFFLLNTLANQLCAQSASVQMDVVSVEQGLPSNSVYALCQDRNGFIWMGTGDGVCRYDGYRFKAFRKNPGDSLSLPYNIASVLFEDHKGMLWAGTPRGLCRYDPARELFIPLLRQEENPNSINNDVITAIHEDVLGQLWIGTGGGGINLLDREKQTFQHYFPDTLTPGYESLTIINGFCNDRQHADLLWVAMRIGTQSGLYSFNIRTKRFTRCELDDSWESATFHSIFEDRDGTLWLSIERGFLLMDRATGITRKFDDSANAPTQRITLVREKEDGKLWILVYKEGLFEYDPAKRHFKIVADKFSQGAVNDFLLDILEDRSGVVWIATMGTGVYRWRPEKKTFLALQGDPSNPRYAVGGFTTALCEDRQGRLWIGTNWKGLDCFNRNTGQFEPIDFKTGDLRKATLWVYSLTESKDGSIWVGTNGRGVFHLDPAAKTYKTYLQLSDNPSDQGFKYVRTLLTTRTGDIWAGTFAGLYRFNPATETWTAYRHDPAQPNSLSYGTVSQILEDHSGVLWVGTQGALSRMDPNTGAFRHFLYDASDVSFLRSGEVQVICADEKNVIWAGTPRGLYRLQFSEKSDSEPVITHYTDGNGLLSNSICGLLEDGRGRLWISSVRGLSVFKNPRHDARTPPDFQHFNLRDGLQDYAFMDHSFFKNQRGEMFFGGEKGYNIFHPDSIFDNPHVPRVVFTSFEKYDLRRPELGAIAVPGISVCNEIALSYQNNIFTIAFAALDFRNPAQNRYAYQLEGFNDAWIQLGNQHQVTFTNLDPGTYILRVKGSNNDGVWNEEPAVLKIVVSPPWYRSWLAYFCYAVLIVGSMYFFYQNQLRRRLELAEAERLKSLDEFKSRFFTNITHEFRTPLTVILGMTEAVLRDPVTQSNPVTQAKPLTLIKRSGENLLRLINQLLDLAKLESKNLKISYIQGDVLPYLRYISESLHSLADAQNVVLRVESDQDQIVMDYDPERLLQIVHNLLSNAIKFTSSNGHITLSISANAGFIALKVADTGAGIPSQDLPHIFDRFYQAKNLENAKAGGTGIGLALTKELVNLLGGSISVESEVGTGTVFRVQLPITNAATMVSEEPISSHIKNEFPALPLAKEPHHHADATPLPALLIVEDNPDVMQYLATCLQETYTLDFAYNGRAGIEKALETIPDLIVSDVMMPEKDGFAVCSTLKNDERSSHIPIVLLTAKADVENRIAGLRHGADAYLAKPFHREELLATLANLFEQRKTLQLKYKNWEPARIAPETAIQPVPSAAPDVENIFLQKVAAHLDKHLDDADFGVPQLSRAMGLSQSQLYRKIKALTDLSTAAFIRRIRLHKGKQLLQTTDQTIAEIAYDVGFSTPNYFSDAFFEEFGMRPNAMRG